MKSKTTQQNHINLSDCLLRNVQLDTTDGRLRSEKHWVYHPILDGYGPAPEDPLLEKARHLREMGATIVTDTALQEGMGVVHLLEWIEPTCDDDANST